MAAFVKVTAYPALRQVTIISESNSLVDFTVVVEACLVFPPLPWEVVVSVRNTSRNSWRETKLAPSPKPFKLLTRPPPEVNPVTSRYHHIYVGAVPVDAASPLTFRIKYRLDAFSPWYWVEDQGGTSTGEVIVQQKTQSGQVALSDYMKLEPGWDVLMSYCEKTKSSIATLTIQTEGACSTGKDFTVVTKVLGSLLNQQRYFALGQVTEPWIAPRHGASEFDMPEDGLLCCFLTGNGQCITMLGLSGLGASQVLIKSTTTFDIAIQARNDSSVAAVAKVVVAIAADVESSISAVMNLAREMFANSKESNLFSEGGLKQIHKQESDFTNSKLSGDLEDWYDGLIYCTWNSLGWDLNPQKILNGLTSLLKSGLQVSTLIIDDNWQTIDNSDSSIPRMHRAMERLEANDSFPDGFASGIASIRAEHPYIGDIAVWHALLGYWGGISPRGQLARDYTVSIFHTQYWRHVKKDICTIDPDDIHRFYDDFYRFLASCGITAVKTDVQFMEGEFASGTARARFLDSYASAWTAAHLTHLNGRAISCMSLIPQNILRSFLRTDLPKVLLRNSDDFFPTVPLSHPLHLFNNAHNAMLTRHLNVVADWDMFQTSHPYSSFHAAGRCLSGGPISITDTPGEHDLDLIHEMTATNPASKTIALRPSIGGSTMSVWDRFASRNLLKIGALHGANEKFGTAMLGLFNMDDKENTELVPISDFPMWSKPNTSNLPGKSERLLRTHHGKRFFPLLDPIESSPLDKLLYATINARGFDIVYSHAVHTMVWKTRTVSLAMLGLLHKMTGPAAVVSWLVAVVEGSMQLNVELKGLGVLGVWFSKETCLWKLGNPIISLDGQLAEKEVTMIDVENGGTVMQFDVLDQWKSMRTIPQSRTVRLIVTWK